MGGGPAPSYIKPVTTAPLCPWGFYPSGRVHHALDYPTPVGTKFRIARAGVVKVAGWSTTGFGNHVRVLLDDGNTVIYGHLSKFYVKVGQRVTAGQFGGETGNSGNSTGPHIHMEVRGSSYDPTTAWDFTSRLINYPTPTPTVTPTPAPEDPFMSITVKNPGDGTQWKLEMALWSMWTYAIREWYSVTGKTMPTKWYDNVAPDGKVTNPLDGTAWEIPSVLWSIWWHNFNGATAAATPPPPPPSTVPLHGVDTSSYQDSVLATWIASEDFLISKATEGKGFNAPSYSSQISKIRAAGKKAGAYHYAWPENGWKADFDHFVAIAGLKVGEVGALDFEPWATKQPNADPTTFPAYVVGWADAYKARFGVDPLFYAPDYFVRSIKTNATPEQWARIAALPFWKPGNKGIYVTDPAGGYGDTFGFQTLAMWQWTDKPLDRNILYVDWSTIAVKKV